MNLKVLFLLLLYYSSISIFFLNAVANNEGTDYNVTINLNDSSLVDSEIDTGGVFSSGISFLRFTGFIFFGVGLPNDTPSWFSTIFIIWQTILTIFIIGFIISSIWNG